MAPDTRTVYLIRHDRSRITFVFDVEMQANNRRMRAQRLLDSIRNGDYDDWSVLDSSMILSQDGYLQVVDTEDNNLASSILWPY